MATSALPLHVLYTIATIALSVVDNTFTYIQNIPTHVHSHVYYIPDESKDIVLLSNRELGLGGTFPGE